MSAYPRHIGVGGDCRECDKERIAELEAQIKAMTAGDGADDDFARMYQRILELEQQTKAAAIYIRKIDDANTELEAEVERLKYNAEDDKQTIAHHAMTRSGSKRHTELRAENERLNAERKYALGRWQNSIETATKLRREVERLQKQLAIALKAIGDAPHDDECATYKAELMGDVGGTYNGYPHPCDCWKAELDLEVERLKDERDIFKRTLDKRDTQLTIARERLKQDAMILAGVGEAEAALLVGEALEKIDGK